ncbi:hypothetical protein CB0940_10456 [Cercospora beticola]|uniref:Uncharacterized protein n=1 Tax=Cercospora beticola TaxID=122368 RepID=A0A2G5HTP2_CERBT|nr:hypothetical protein CB0940_10456 [Cercospora beticola]PIA95895.1 hypothetical protein CB0940_10456 [Cercospora beticola]WPB07174.1 hypothetical protein RHO25_011834 [Cercospora beticola]CAK1367133.1 unnamed protein product [Cercospora beticola]
MRRHYTLSSQHQQCSQRLDENLKAKLPPGGSMPTKVHTPPPPPLYKTQFLSDPIMTVPSYKHRRRGDCESLSFFQDLDELSSMKYVSRDASGDDMLERALLQMRKDQTAFLAADEIRNAQQSASSRQQSCRRKPSHKPSQKKVPSRDTVRPSLAATHPALYTRIPSQKNSRADQSAFDPGMMQRTHAGAGAAHGKPVQPATRQDSARATTCESADLHGPRIGNTPEHSVRVVTQTVNFAVSMRSPSADTAHLPLINFQDPSLSNPQPRHLRCDFESEFAGLVSPVLLTALPFGSVIETANLYPDEKCEKCQMYAKGDRTKCPDHIGDAGTQGFTPWASLHED